MSSQFSDSNKIYILKSISKLFDSSILQIENLFLKKNFLFPFQFWQFLLYVTRSIILISVTIYLDGVCWVASLRMASLRNRTPPLLPPSARTTNPAAPSCKFSWDRKSIQTPTVQFFQRLEPKMRRGEKIG